MKKFTLVEIMIVVAIIAVLSAIAIPNYTAYQKSARKKAKENNISMVTTAKERYRLNYGKATGDDVTFDNIKQYLTLIDEEDDLSVGGDSITIGVIGTKSSYPTY